jgi:hypothetical protein
LDQDDLAAFAADPQDPVAVLVAEIADVRARGLEDPQSQQPSMATMAKSFRLATGVQRPAVAEKRRETVEGLNRRTSCIHRMFSSSCGRRARNGSRLRPAHHVR